MKRGASLSLPTSWPVRHAETFTANGGYDISRLNKAVNINSNHGPDLPGHNRLKHQLKARTVFHVQAWRLRHVLGKLPDFADALLRCPFVFGKPAELFGCPDQFAVLFGLKFC